MKPNNNNNHHQPDRGVFDDAEVIHRYTRKQAIEDGVLVDLSEWAREVGFKIPVACTAAVWHEYVVPPEGTRELGQSERGRGHDLVWMCYVAIRRAEPGAPALHFDVLFLGADRRQHEVRLQVVCGPGDDGEPVITILKLDED